MQGTLFCRDRKSAEFIIHGLKRANVTLDVIDSRKSYRQDQVIFQSSVFFFQGALMKEDIALVQLIQMVKSTSVIVLLDPQDLKHVDDFDFVFSKPYSYPYVALLVQKKIAEKSDKNVRQRLKHGDMTLSLHRHILSREGRKITLSNKEFSLMQYFFLNPGRIVSRADILDSVWDRNCPISTNTVDVHVSRLRHKLKKCRASAFLRTIPCLGYQWSSDAT